MTKIKSILRNQSPHTNNLCIFWELKKAIILYYRTGYLWAKNYRNVIPMIEMDD